ncbi:MAG: tyrosine-protein phosphatase [Nannocystaceae bacterium]|nr:tyrosine-protein phosphatase [Myxococcales bacterium]
MYARPPPPWIALGGGALAIGGRPGKRSYPGLEQTGCTDVLCLLSDEEGAPSLREQADARGFTWHHLPLRRGDPPARERDEAIRAQLSALVELVRGGARLYIHCAAGLHRTGMITAALLLLADGAKIDLEARIRALRPETADALRADRVAWAYRVAQLGR